MSNLIDHEGLNKFAHLLAFPVMLADSSFIDNPGVTHAHTIIRSGLARGMSLSPEAIATLLLVGTLVDVELRSSRGYIGHFAADLVAMLHPAFHSNAVEHGLWTLATFGLLSRNRDHDFYRLPNFIVIPKADDGS
jgi:hypothetical protein